MKFENMAIVAGAVAFGFWLLKMKQTAQQIEQGASNVKLDYGFINTGDNGLLYV